MAVLVTSFYSPDYVSDAMELARSCRRFNLESRILPMPMFDSWVDGVAHKPKFILDVLETIHDGSGLLWTDADSKFFREPDLSIFNAIDFAASLFQWSPAHAVEMLTGTLFFRKTPRVVDFVKRWTLATPTWRKANLDTPEQLSLKATWEEDRTAKHPLRFLELPREWVFIEPDFKEMYPAMVPVVQHFQASRRVRR